MDRRPDIELDDDDEREEEEHIQQFLKEALVEPFHPYSPGAGKSHVLAIVKFRGSTVIDVDTIESKGKFEITNQGKLFRLATYKSEQACSVFFSKADMGLLQ